MSERSDLDSLRDIQEAIERILRYTRHMSYDDSMLSFPGFLRSTI